MNNTISFKFNVETDSHTEAANLLQVMLEQIRALESSNTSYKSIEVDLFKPEPGQKTACLTVHTHDSVIREESKEGDWNQAIGIVFRQLEATSEHVIKID